MQKKAMIGCVILFLVLCISGYLFYSQKNSLSNYADSTSGKNDTQAAKTSADKPSLSEQVGDTETKAIPGWKTYENQKVGYKLQYPSDWTATDEGKYDQSYPYDTEFEKEYADTTKGYDYYIGITSSLYGTNASGVTFNKESILKGIAANSNYKKIFTAGGEGYYIAEETPGGTMHWIVQILGDKGVVTMDCNIDNSSKESLYKQIIGTFQFN